MSDRAWHIRMARTYLAQAMAVRQYPQHSGWHARLLSWTAKRRLQAAATPNQPEQGSLF